MRAPTLRFASFQLDFWRSQAFVVWSCDSFQLSAWFEERWKSEWSKHDGWRGLFIPIDEISRIERKPTLFVVLREWSGSIEDIALLAHECYHATRYLHKLLDDPEWRDVEEDEARLMERIMTGCLEALQAAQSSD